LLVAELRALGAVFIFEIDAEGTSQSVSWVAIFLYADQDVKRIAHLPKRVPWLLISGVRFVGFTCGANNLKTIALIRKEAAKRGFATLEKAALSAITSYSLDCLRP
jgi:hypothetical protein